MGKKVNNKNFNNEVLTELWKNAVFDENSLNAIKEVAENSIEKRKDGVNNFIKSESSCFELATIRNRNLVTWEEQQILRKTVVAFFGLSVGSHSALAWMMLSRASNIKIIDPDLISPTNLNRLRFGWGTIGRKKIDVLKEMFLDIHPYVNVITSIKTDIDSVRNLIHSEPKVCIIVDAIDDIRGKILLRKFAKEYKIPLVSAADVGDMVMLDIERYDLNPQLELFLGRVPGIENVDFNLLTDIDKKKLIIKLVGFEKNNERLLDSLSSIGESLATWPQLGPTAQMAGGIIALTIKKILLGEKIVSGRYYISLDELLVQDFNSKKRIAVRKAMIGKIKKKLYIKD